MRWMKKDSLDLEGLAMPKGFSDPEALAQIKLRAQSRTPEEIVAAMPKYDVVMRDINSCIYNSCIISGTGLPIFGMRKWQLERMKSLFGFPDDDACYAWIRSHDRCDPTAGELLVKDALVTGKWEELPAELRIEYQRRKGEVQMPNQELML